MTKPVEDLLPLPMEPEAEPYITLYYDALHELVCFGTHILSWNLELGKGKIGKRNETDMAVPLLFRHIIELLDATSVQVKMGVIVPCKVQLRAMLEAYLSLEYLLEKDRERRATCFLLVDHYRKLNLHRRLSPNTREGTVFAQEIKEFGLHLPNFVPIKEAEQVVKDIESLVASPIYQEARKEYLSKTNQNRSNLDVKWYTLFNGPNSIIWLAKRLRKYDLYEFFYRSWSNQTHATDLSTKVLVRGSDGNSAITQLRNMQV